MLKKKRTEFVSPGGRRIADFLAANGVHAGNRFLTDKPVTVKVRRDDRYPTFDNVTVTAMWPENGTLMVLTQEGPRKVVDSQDETWYTAPLEGLFAGMEGY